MPVEVKQRCPNCCEVKPIGEFTPVRTALDKKAHRMHRVREQYCRDCLAKDSHLPRGDR